MRCLIVGENPGNTHSAYFYDPPPKIGKDPVKVRSQLLKRLNEIGLIPFSNLESFKTGGFLFDHGIRCPIDTQKEIDLQRQLAQRFKSPLAHQASYLMSLINQADKVWVMGHIARDAVTFQLKDHESFIRRKLSRKLTPPVVHSKFFFSRYLTRCPEEILDQIFECFKNFLR